MAKKRPRNNSKKHSRKVSSRKRIRQSKLLRGIFITGIVLVAILLLLILTNVGFFERAEEEFHVSIQDECSLVVGNLIHQIRDEGDCKVKCINDCGIRGVEFSRIDFAAQNGSCHLCDCYCK